MNRRRNPGNPARGPAAGAPSAAAILRDALDATGRTQTDLAAGVFGIGLSTLTDGLAGRSSNPLLVRLAWLLARYPEHADELETQFRP